MYFILNKTHICFLHKTILWISLCKITTFTFKLFRLKWKQKHSPNTEN